MPEWYFDEHYRRIANGGGIDDDFAAEIRDQPQIRAQLRLARQMMIQSLDGARIGDETMLVRALWYVIEPDGRPTITLIASDSVVKHLVFTR